MTQDEPSAGGVRVGSSLTVRALDGVPTIAPGDDLVDVVSAALQLSDFVLRDQDIVVVASKIVSRAEGCFVDLSTLRTRAEAMDLARRVDKDPRLVELVLQESDSISRTTKGALIVRHRLGFISANAAIDSSNAVPVGAPDGTGPWVLVLPRSPDASAQRLRDGLKARFSVEVGVLITDSWGRPFRRGTVGFAIGLAGVPALWDRRGASDRHGRELQATETAVADSIAAAADLVAGQADEGRPITVVRGLDVGLSTDSSTALLRDPDQDLYA